ncbi:hypothetical protein XELAEV_18041925mg, partial [Xenopus laevis]
MAVHKSMLWGSKDIDLWMGMLAPKPQPLQNQTKNVAIAVINMNALFARGHTLPFVVQRDLLKQENPIRENSTKKVITPVILSAMLPYLKVYPNQQKATILESGFSEGFIIPTDNTKWSPVVVDNLKSAKKYPEIVREKLFKELSYSRIAGPFEDIPLFNMRISPLGVVPKKETGSFRLIHHLSFANGLSINDSISPELCSVEYASFDKAVSLLRLCGAGAQLAKSFHFDGGYYYDKCLPMGCAVSCNYFELFSNFLEWTVKFETAKKFGIPIAMDKTFKPSTTLQFLGIEIDSVKIEFRLPDAKLQKLRSLLSAALAAKKLTLKHIQSLVGHLNFATRIIPIANKDGVNGDLDHLILLMLEHVDAQHSVAYVKKQLAGISFFLRLFGQVDVTKAAVVKQFLKGWHKRTFVADKRKPITFDLLHKLLLVS